MGRSATTKTTVKNARGAAKKTAVKPAAKKIVNSRATAAKNAVVAKKPAGRSATTGSARSSRSTPTQ